MTRHTTTRPSAWGRYIRRGAMGSWLLVAAVGSPLCAQRPATITLKAPQAEHPEPLTQPSAVLELRDGRVLVADSRDRLLFIYDFDKEAATQVSRQGSGPLEYQFPSAILASGDSIIVMDFMQQRMLILDARGVPLRTHRLVATGDVTSSILKVGSIFGIDTKGRFYSETRGVAMVPGKMPTMSDTVALVRWTTLGERGDTLAVRVEHVPQPRMSGNPTDGLSIKLSMTAFLPRDSWTLFPSGSVAIARASDYHTEWVDPSGRTSVGPRVAYTPITVTEADKALARKVTREAAERGLKLGVSMAGSGQKMPRIKMDVEEPDAWPKVKPPFGGVLAAPDGRLWVTRTIAEYSEVMEYDILAPGGKRERTVRLPRHVTVIGFGKGIVYGVRKDEDDLRYLQRYRIP